MNEKRECPDCGEQSEPKSKVVNEEWGKVTYIECQECGYEDEVRY